MKIAIVSHLKFPIAQPFAGGLELHTHLLATRLKERGHDVTLFASRGSDPSLGLVGVCDPTGDDCAGAIESADTVVHRQMESLTMFFPPQSRVLLQGDLVCYARAVVRDEWPLLASGQSSTVVDHWVTQIDTNMVAVPIQTPKEVEVFNVWFQQSAERQEGRRGRVAESVSLIPPGYRMIWPGAG